MFRSENVTKLRYTVCIMHANKLHQNIIPSNQSGANIKSLFEKLQIIIFIKQICL